MIQLQQVTLQRGAKVLLDQADLTLQAKQKAGIVGPNGAGKTSLFKLLLGELSVDHGYVQFPKQISMAHIRQEMPNTEQNAVEYALEGDIEYFQLQQRLRQAEASEDGLAIAEIHARLAEIGGYESQARASKILIGLGFTQTQLTAPVNSFSGGWRMRLNLAQVLLARADVLLLDEPTNHLDLEAIIWLEDWLQQCQSTILLISHDRAFLDQTCTHVVHLRDQKLYFYTGNYSTFEKEYSAQLAVQQATYRKQQQQRAHMQKFVDRFRYKASKAKQAQSRLKMLEKMDQVDPVRQLNPFRFSFKKTVAAGNPMLQFTNASVGYTEEPILSGINFALRDGDRIGLIGLNGAGKSTFIKLLAGELLLKTGKKVGSNKLKIGYFAQHQLEQLDLSASPFRLLQRIDPKITDAETRRYLGGFNFQGDRVFEPITNFSGGEKARLVLALIIWQQPNLLLLDEPTNHLDMEMRQALTDALQEYNGAVVVVSHDRYLIESTVDELWLVADGSVQRFDGDLNDYRTWCLNRSSVNTPPTKPAQSPKQQKPLQSQLNKIENKLEKTLAELKICEEALSAPELYQQEKNRELEKLISQQRRLQAEIEGLEMEMITLLEKLES